MRRLGRVPAAWDSKFKVVMGLDFARGRSQVVELARIFLPEFACQLTDCWTIL